MGQLPTRSQQTPSLLASKWGLRQSHLGADTSPAVRGRGLGAGFARWAPHTRAGAAVPRQVEDLDAVLWKMVAVGDLQSQGFTQTDQAPQQPSKRGECPAPNGSRDSTHH